MTQEIPTIAGRVPDSSGRKPKTSDEIRVCAVRGCDTKLSRYNIKDACYRHRTTRFPRVRGRPD